MALSHERIDDLAQNYGLDWLDYEPFARAIEAEARAKAFSEAYDLLFDVKGCKATKFDAQNAIRAMAAPVDAKAWIALARARQQEPRP